MCEEVQHPATQVPKAMVATIGINTIAGLLFLIPLVFVLPELSMLASLASGQPVPPIIKSAIGSSGGAFGLLIPLMVLAIICGIGCTTASSRCAWAFSRDGAVPGSKIWMKVNHSLDVPLNAMMLCMVVEILLGLIYFGSSAAFNAFSGVGVISLTFSYACPIAISVLNRRKAVQNAKFSLGKFGYALNFVAIGTFHLPPETHYLANNSSRSLVLPCASTFLHAHVCPCYAHHGQLCPGRVRCRHWYFRYLVLGLGSQELRRSSCAWRVSSSAKFGDGVSSSIH